MVLSPVTSTRNMERFRAFPFRTLNRSAMGLWARLQTGGTFLHGRFVRNAHATEEHTHQIPSVFHNAVNTKNHSFRISRWACNFVNPCLRDNICTGLMSHPICRISSGVHGVLPAVRDIMNSPQTFWTCGNTKDTGVLYWSHARAQS